VLSTDPVWKNSGATPPKTGMWGYTGGGGVQDQTKEELLEMEPNKYSILNNRAGHPRTYMIN